MSYLTRSAMAKIGGNHRGGRRRPAFQSSTVRIGMPKRRENAAGPPADSISLTISPLDDISHHRVSNEDFADNIHPASSIVASNDNDPPVALAVVGVVLDLFPRFKRACSAQLYVRVLVAIPYIGWVKLVSDPWRALNVVAVDKSVPGYLVAHLCTLLHLGYTVPRSAWAVNNQFAFFWGGYNR